MRQLEEKDLKDGMEVWYGYATFKNDNRLTSRPYEAWAPEKYILRLGNNGDYKLYRTENTEVAMTTISYYNYGHSMKYSLYGCKEAVLSDLNDVVNCEIMRRCDLLKSTTDSLEDFKKNWELC